MRIDEAKTTEVVPGPLEVEKKRYEQTMKEMNVHMAKLYSSLLEAGVGGIEASTPPNKGADEAR